MSTTTLFTFATTTLPNTKVNETLANFMLTLYLGYNFKIIGLRKTRTYTIVSLVLEQKS